MCVLCSTFYGKLQINLVWLHSDVCRIYTVRLHAMQCMVLLSQFCPSVRCMHCDKAKWCTVDILIPHETAITLVFWHQHWLDGPFPVKYSRKVTHLLRKMLTLRHTLMFCAGQAGAYLFKLLCRPGQSVLVFLAWRIAMASLVPGQPCTEPLAVPTTAQWTFRT